MSKESRVQFTADLTAFFELLGIAVLALSLLLGFGFCSKLDYEGQAKRDAARVEKEKP